MHEPRPVFKQRLIENSFSKEFEQSMIEWVCISEIFSRELDFCSNCQLCGAAVYDINHVIHNVKTKKELKIGSECVKRFETSHQKHLNRNPTAIRKLRKRFELKRLQMKLIDQYHFICNQGKPDEE